MKNKYLKNYKGMEYVYAMFVIWLIVDIFIGLYGSHIGILLWFLGVSLAIIFFALPVILILDNLDKGVV